MDETVFGEGHDNLFSFQLNIGEQRTSRNIKNLCWTEHQTLGACFHPKSRGNIAFSTRWWEKANQLLYKIHSSAISQRTFGCVLCCGLSISTFDALITISLEIVNQSVVDQPVAQRPPNNCRQHMFSKGKPMYICKRPECALFLAIAYS